MQGVVAVACTDSHSFNQRVDSLGGAPAPHAVLVWNFRDPIHPELVLESPYEVFCFQSNPLQPDIITAGLYNGQIIMWDTASQEVTFLHSPLHLLLLLATRLGTVLSCVFPAQTALRLAWQHFKMACSAT